MSHSTSQTPGTNQGHNDTIESVSTDGAVAIRLGVVASEPGLTLEALELQCKRTVQAIAEAITRQGVTPGGRLFALLLEIEAAARNSNRWPSDDFAVTSTQGVQDNSLRGLVGQK